MSELEDILNHLETTSLEPHNDYTDEFSYKDQKTLWKYIKNLQKENQELRGQIIEKNISETEFKDKLVKERERINNLVDSLNLRINDYLRDKKCLIDNKTNPIKIKTEPYNNSRSKMPLEVVSVYIEPITLEFIQERLDDTK